MSSPVISVHPPCLVDNILTHPGQPQRDPDREAGMLLIRRGCRIESSSHPGGCVRVGFGSLPSLGSPRRNWKGFGGDLVSSAFWEPGRTLSKRCVCSGLRGSRPWGFDRALVFSGPVSSRLIFCSPPPSRPHRSPPFLLFKDRFRKCD